MTTAPTTTALAQVLRHIDPARHVARQKHLGLRFALTRDHAGGADQWMLQVNPQLRMTSWVRLENDVAPLALAVRPDPAAALIGERHWHDYEGDARLLAWSMQHENLLAALERLLDCRLAPAGFAKEPAAMDPLLDGPTVDFEWTEPASNITWRGSLALTGASCDALLSNAESTPVDYVPKRWLGVPIPVALRARGPSMRADAVRACDSGDVIVLGQRDGLIDSVVAVHGDGTPIPARCAVDTTGVTLRSGSLPDWSHQTLTEESITMPDNSATAPAPAPGAGIPVRLSIQTAAVDVTINDLEQLGTGVVLPLDVPVAGANVTILANGAPIGDGELVAAGDKLGVCIRRWQPDGL